MAMADCLGMLARSQVDRGSGRRARGESGLRCSEGASSCGYPSGERAGAMMRAGAGSRDTLEPLTFVSWTMSTFGLILAPWVLDRTYLSPWGLLPLAGVAMA